jgi:hypothetical protein
MKHLTKILIAFCLFGYGTGLRAQNTIPATGGNGTGAGGSISYTVGQIVFNTFSGTNGTIGQGVQQSYEISVITAIENTQGITLECYVYPNPTSRLIKLIVESFDFENLRIRLYDINGVMLLDKKIESEETEISLESYTSSFYFLKVLNKNMEVKTFKIVKK